MFFFLILYFFLAASTKSLNKKVNFRDFYPNLSDEGFDLLTKLLSIDPKQRLTANEVLEHPYLVKYRDPITETTAISPLDFDFEKKVNKMKHFNIVALIYNYNVHYHRAL